MNNQQAMIELIKATSGQANVLTIPRPYIEFMGSLDGGLFLSQLIYWSDRGGQDGWFYKTYAEWENELTLSKYEVTKQVKILKDRGILETKIKKANGAPTVHYRFSFDQFQQSFVKFLNYEKSSNLTMESEETSRTITETTTETRSYINGPAKNSQNQNGEDGFDRADQAELDNLNFIADQLARVTKIRVATADEPTIERLKKTALLGYQLAEYCQISLSKLKPRKLNGHFQYSKALENFLGDIITLAADGVTPADLKANKDWWYNKYWLGRDKHQPPTSAQVCAMWGQFEAAQSALASATAGPQLSDVAKANYARLLAEQAK